MKHYPELNAKTNAPEREQEILTFWDKDDTFRKSVARRNGAEEFVFYDGPPFANGLPHYGHIMISYVKDVVARYQTMRGKKVERRLGWDCHGLPAEMAAEKQLGVSGHKQIEEYGVEKFNAFCRSVDLFPALPRPCLLSPQEIRVLAHFFREQQANIPDGLEEFAMAVEKAIYNSMSIDEAQAFYS